MRAVNLTEREREVVIHALNAVRLHKNPRVFVYADADPFRNMDTIKVLADVIEKLHTADRARPATKGTGGRHRWSRRGNVCETCGARRVREMIGTPPAARPRTFYIYGDTTYVAFPCPGGSSK